jgi:RNA polymerase sigma-70 factor (ECF subfamily)
VKTVPPAFERMVLDLMPLLYRVARRMSLDPVEAEDAVAESLVRAVKAWETFDGRFPRAWMIRILRNTVLGNRRSLEERPSVAVPDEVRDPKSMESAVENRIAAQAIVRAIGKLPEEYAIVVSLCDVEECSYQEVAAALDIPLGTVRSRLFRGRAMIRQLLTRYAGGSS